MNKPPLIRRLAGICVATIAALALAVVTTTPAGAQTTTPRFTTASALTVVNPGNQRFVEFDPVQLQMTATGGASPYTWSATGLSRWLSINASTGLISGIASAGLYTVTVTARDTAGSSSSATFTVWVPRECRTC
ncbi:Ig domain-containing protein [Actinocrispum sp. NPDC049592]|uniref:Ig domain-containing protein n=1 Tax=Actinocrispum sp. NPDC049592 TaxID=3154835 RepID=UPI003412447B